MIKDRNAGSAVYAMIHTIQSNKDYLSEIDGKIGDGDHGINMNKGFTICEQKLSGREFSLSEGLYTLSETLQEDIGGSMGPLYGVFFEEMAAAVTEEINETVFGNMMRNAVDAVMQIGNARRGDKTLLDTLLPAVEAYEAAVKAGESFSFSLEKLKAAAAEGWKSTEGMVALIGRASRLGERSRGVLDAGATSSHLLILSLANSLQSML